jgi:(2Fe-2S) ferredoxin
MLMVCTGTGCVSAHGFEVRDAMRAALRERGLQNDYLVVQTGCNGFCAMGPIIVVYPEGIIYMNIKAEDVPELVEEHFVKGRPVERLF